MMRTEDAVYTDRLERHASRWWKRVCDVQRPYRWNIRRIAPGSVLDVGCGLGRNLMHLDGRGIGVDHNAHSVARARARGLTAYTPSEFLASQQCRPGRFDALLLAHVAEHMPYEGLVELIGEYRDWVRDDGRLILICPQEAGYLTDPSHVEFMDFSRLASAACATGFEPEMEYSFPFPRLFGRVFVHNEFVIVARKRGMTART